MPDEGTLTDYESWMLDFMKELAKGIEHSSGKSTTEKLICGQDFPHEVMKSAMLKVDRVYLENAIDRSSRPLMFTTMSVIYQHLVQRSQWQEFQGERRG
ncbi:MAG: hypothetical protein IJ192_05265 [Clostridia bacterium]|nr:hypothetical protein [Clostridia bacterium]